MLKLESERDSVKFPAIHVRWIVCPDTADRAYEDKLVLMAIFKHMRVEQQEIGFEPKRSYILNEKFQL